MKLLKRIQQFVINLSQHPLWVRVLDWTKTHSLPGLRRVPIYNLVRFVLDETRKDALVTRANSMAFSFFMAIFPSIIFVVSLLPYLPYGDRFFVTLHQSIREMMPGEAGKWVFETVEDLLTTERRDLLSVGFLFTLWFSSNGMLSMMNGLRKNYRHVFKRHNLWQRRVIAIQLTVLLSFVLFASMVLVILGDTLLGFLFRYIQADWFTRMILFGFRWIVITVLFYSGISLIYRYGAGAREQLPFLNAGATLATMLSMLVSWGFSFYADNFSNFNTVYGSIGTILALLLWIQANCVVLLIGSDLNAGIAVIRAQRTLSSEQENG